MPEADFSPVVLERFNGGWVTSKDRESDSLRPHESPDLLNVDFDGFGSFTIRKGFERFGDEDNTTGSITTTHTFRRPIADDEIAMRQHFDNTNYTLQYYHTGTAAWEDVPITGTIGNKLGYANWTSSTDTVDYVYYCDDGNIALQRWNGGHTQLNGALSGGEATVTVDSTTGFDAAGDIDIGGTSVSYTGKTATTFTGCSGTPAASDDAPVEQEADNFSASSGSKPNGNIMVVFNGQLAVAEDQFVKISDTDDFTDWGSGLATTKGFADGRITALRAKDKNLIVSTEHAVRSIEYEFTGDQTGFQLRTDDIEVAPLYGAKSQEGMIGADGKIFYVGADNVIRNIVHSPVSALYDTSSVSENIRNTLKDYTMTNASAIFYRNKLYFAVQSDESNINDTVLVFDLKEARTNESGEAWSRYTMYVGDFFVYDNALHFGSSATPNTYRCFEDSNGDDIVLDDGAAIPWHYATPLFDFGKPYLKYRITKLVSRGFISNESEVGYTALYDYGTESEQELTLDGDDETWVNIPSALTLGEEVSGEGETGSGEDPFNGEYPFTYVEFYGTVDFYNAQIKISGNTASERFKQTRLVMYVQPQDDVMTN